MKLDRLSDDFLKQFTEVMGEKPTGYSIDAFVHTYKLQPLFEIGEPSILNLAIVRKKAV
ncbi:putative transposase [Streptococcus oralis]|nr:putative transposase [Streptococcus oralis]